MSHLKNIVRKVLPARWHLVPRLQRAIIEHAGSCVVSGPFEGTRYVAESVGSSYAPKLLGTYELELHEIVDVIVSKKPDVIFNIGAAEGYYSTGLARLLPMAQVVAWENSQKGRMLSRNMAEQNGIGEKRLESHGLCTVSALRKRLDGFSCESSIFLIVDIEGGEALLLDPDAIPRLSQTEMLIEVHECFIEGVQQLLLDRFRNTHSVSEIKARQRSLADWPEQLDFCSNRIWDDAKVAIMAEHRPPGMSWLFLQKL